MNAAIVSSLSLLIGFARQSQLVTASENGDHENTKE
jgi:hypothetical protein